ncbi:MAG TPA: type II secretion system F family protein [Oxalicibacterium sp.]|uniref:type II secretion system F family protein n=1 Tax=Oxalicibacterium sp. TaxID=2766525 RepID=UPI002B5E051B|nr:type II secretion system F family protein [Oxalicibacterium sp.]HWU98160.1 type II secretion system F family protein [Oxalicibacterium sp.]
MKFVARTLSSNNVITEIVLEAEDDADAHLQLSRQSLKALSIRPLRKFGLSFGSPQQKFSVLLFSQELLALLKAGLSLIEALEGLVEKETRPETQRIVNNMLTALREGKKFSTALQLQASVFPALYVGLVQAAENTSNLPQTLERYIHYHQRIDQISSKVISASLYPVILLLVGGAVTGFLVGFVVPRFAVVYQGTGRSLPLLSQWLLYWGEFAEAHGSILLITAIILGAMSFFFLKSFIKSGKLFQLIQRIPSIGDRYRLYLLSRLYLTLGMLLQGGMPIVPALQTVQGVIPVDWQNRLVAVRFKIESGQTLSNALTEQALTTPITVRMLRVGEQTGQLGYMLHQAAEFYETDIARFIDRFMRTFEPALMAAIGIVVGLIVVLLYMPIFDLAGSLQ